MNKVFKKVLNRSTGQFIVVSENAKCTSKIKANKQGTISISNAQSCIKKVFKTTSIALAVVLSSSTSFAATSNVTGDVGAFLTQIYSQFETNTQRTLTTEEISQLDEYYTDKYAGEIEGIFNEVRNTTPTATAIDVIQYMDVNGYHLTNDSNHQQGFNNSTALEGTGLTSYGVGNNNHGVANVVVGIENNTVGYLNNVVGSSLNVNGDHNVVIGSNESTMKDAGGDVLNLQVLKRNASAGNVSYGAHLNGMLSELYSKGTISLQEYVANASYFTYLDNDFYTNPAVNGLYNTVQGNYNDVKGNKYTLFGNSNTVAAGSSGLTSGGTIVGNSNYTSGNDNTVVGSGNFITGSNNTVIGANDMTAFNEALASINATIYENSAELNADLSALDNAYGSYITGNNVVAIGTNLNVSASNSVVIGNNVTNNVSGATVIGNDLVVDAQAANEYSYITNAQANNQVMFGGQRFTQILDGVNAFDGVALGQINAIASVYYEAHNDLVGKAEALNLTTFQDPEKLFQEVAARIDVIKAEDQERIKGEIDLEFANQTAGMAASTLEKTMVGVESEISNFGAQKYQTLRNQALEIANEQDVLLKERLSDSLTESQSQALEQLNAKLDGKKAELKTSLDAITAGKKDDYLAKGNEAVHETAEAKKAEGVSYIKEQDEARYLQSVEYMDDLIANAGTGGTGGATSNTGLGSQANHYDNLEDYAADQDTVLLQNTKDKTDNLVYQSKEDKQSDIDAAINEQVGQAIDVNKAKDEATKNQLASDMANKDADILAKTNDLTRDIVAENTAVTRDLISLQDQVTLNAIITDTDANNAKTLSDLNDSLDALDKVALETGKNVIKAGDEQTYANLEKHILAEDAKTAAQAEKVITESAQATETTSTSFITAADEAIWEEFQKHLGTGGGVTDEASAIAYAKDQDAKNLGTLKLLADAKDQQVLQSAKDYADNKFNNLGDRIANRDAKIQAGVAGAYALSSLPQASYPGQAGTAWSMSSKGGQSAIAVGYTMMSDDSKYLFKSGVARDSKSKFSGGASVTRYILPQ